jgi:tetratricopeptide (TPR) repeat protein
MGQKWAKNLTVLSLLIGAFSAAMPQANAQALTPYVANLQFSNREEQALNLAREATQLAQFERYDLALPRALLAVQLAPKSHQAQWALGTVYLRQEKYDQAIATLKLANTLKDNEPAILFNLGAALLRKGLYGEAIRVLEQGVAIAPNATSGLFDLANALFLSKRYEEAIAKYNRILELDKKILGGNQQHRSSGIRAWQPRTRHATLESIPRASGANRISSGRTYPCPSGSLLYYGGQRKRHQTRGRSHEN